MASTSASESSALKPPVAVVCIGMAGSGKTTFMQRINAHLHTASQKKNTSVAPPYVLNLDPAVRSVPFDSNIDIRDSVNYKEVMKQYNLGPNGGILTSLNLFSTKIDQVMGILEKRCLPTENTKQVPEHIIIDTPGQIEVFVWSASGNILLSSLASSFPTVIAYIIDTPRTTENTSTFMSNMLYAISILYKTKLPMILVFNKTDVKSESEAVEWMRDFEAFQAALRKEEEEGNGESNGYMGSLLNSMSLVLEEFYNQLSVVGVSSMTGNGVEDFFEAVEGKRAEFERDYKPELKRRREDAELQKKQVRDMEVDRMMKDMRVSSKAKGTGKYASKDEPETVSDHEEAMDDEEPEEHAGLVDRDEDEELDEDAMFEEGMKARYEAALQDRLGGGAGASADTSMKGVSDYIMGSQR
nr:gpn-loop gtpase 1 [Quercus suber]